MSDKLIFRHYAPHPHFSDVIIRNERRPIETVGGRFQQGNRRKASVGAAERRLQMGQHKGGFTGAAERRLQKRQQEEGFMRREKTG